jgi:hypothetical protein
MTQDEVLKMAKQAGFSSAVGKHIALDEDLVAFAKLVAQHERKACAKVCDVLAYHPEFASDATKLAAMAIRARGQA